MANDIINISDGVEISVVNGLPRVTKMILTPQMLRDFEDYANIHSSVNPKKSQTEKRKMMLVAGCLANKEVMDLIVINADK